LVVLVRLKLTEDAPVAPAVTLYGPPATLFAVNVPGLATPDPLVLTEIVPVLLEKVPLAPPAAVVAVKVTGE
jgi:hypothetical protein